MAEQRTVDIFLDATVQTQIRELTGSQRFYEALGYLSSWNMTFGYVRITGGFYSGNPELIATYKTTPLHRLGIASVLSGMMTTLVFTRKSKRDFTSRLVDCRPPLMRQAQHNY